MPEVLLGGWKQRGSEKQSEPMQPTSRTPQPVATRVAADRQVLAFGEGEFSITAHRTLACHQEVLQVPSEGLLDHSPLGSP
jgi:hypothetical protein